jgi:3-oxoacyl-[acyl-carrier-protein] synthase II
MPTIWDALRAGRCGVAPLRRVSAGAFACRVGGEIPATAGEFSAKDYVPKHYRKAVKVMARDTEIAVACAKLAVEHAGLSTRAHEGVQPTYASERVGCQIGAGLIAAETWELTSALATAVDDAPEHASRGGFSYRAWGTISDGGRVGGMDNLQPLWMLKYLPNMLACHVSIIHGTEGPSNTITCADASGLLCVGEAMRVIERGGADASLAGSAESKVSLMGIARMTLAGRYGEHAKEGDPARAVRAFSRRASGGVPGEGGAILVLEEALAARSRGAHPLCALAGFGASQGLPDESDGQGLERAIRAALRDAGIAPGEVDAIVPQALGAPANDRCEALALSRVFAGSKAVQLVCIPQVAGDCAAGAAGLQLAVGAMCLREQTLPPRLAGDNLDAGSDILAELAGNLRAEPCPARSAPMKYVLVCSGSLGGQHAAIVLRAV